MSSVVLGCVLKPQPICLHQKYSNISGKVGLWTCCSCCGVSPLGQAHWCNGLNYEARRHARIDFRAGLGLGVHLSPEKSLDSDSSRWDLLES